MSNRTIYIGNMPYTTTKEELIRLVHPRKVERVTIPTDRETDRPRGFAFVEFASDEDALLPCKISMARNSETAPSRSTSPSRAKGVAKVGAVVVGDVTVTDEAAETAESATATSRL